MNNDSHAYLKVTELASDVSATPPLPTSPRAESPAQGRGRAALAMQDARLGPVKIGPLSISRVELYDMGARLSGAQNSPKTQRTQAPDAVDELQFDRQILKQRIQSNDARADITDVLFEAAAQRSPLAPPVLMDVSDPHQEPALRNLDILLRKAQALPSPDMQQALRHQPRWVDIAKSGSVLAAGMGMQFFGIYSGLKGIVDALKNGDMTNAAINASSVGAELSSLLLERAMARTGQFYLEQGAKVLNGFKATSIGKVCIRSAGFLGNVLTLPFDLYSAINSFNDAANSSGKVAQDHYVSAGLSLTGAALSVALGAAALAGFSAAGPLGLLACGVLMLGANIYSAARQVDDIDDYIEISTLERLRSGWFAFTSQDLDIDITQRLQLEKTRVDYSKALEKRARDLLNGTLKDSVDAIVEGRFEVRLQPVKHWKFEWTADESPYTEVMTPTVESRNDEIDARAGPGKNAITVAASTHEKKAILWQLDGGNDRVLGTLDRANYFSFSTGSKSLTGGDRNDSFLFQTLETLKTPASPAANALNGRDGIDTLSLQGQLPTDQSLAYGGHDVDLSAGTLGLRSHAGGALPVQYATLTSIENVETLPGGSSRVLGNHAANLITLNGMNDSADGRSGDDVLWIRGNDCQVTGGPGNDRYVIDLNWGTVTVTESAGETCTFELQWSMERIQRWSIKGTALVISSTRGVDGQLPPRDLVINNVYSQIGEHRQLQNLTLIFTTQDGYSLRPLLPATLETAQDPVIQAMIIQVGIARPAPIILNGGRYTAAADAVSAYYVARGSKTTELQLSGSDSDLQTTVYIGYDIFEIDAVQARYHVDSQRIGAFTYLTYGNACLTIVFSDGSQLTLTDWAGKNPARPTNVTAHLHSAGFRLHRQVLLVLADGTSYRLGLPADHYLDDSANPGERLIDTRDSLLLREGRYLFEPPREGSPRQLPDRPQRVDLYAAAQQTEIFVLHGSGSIYELYPFAGATLRLATPEGDTGSTWVIHTRQLTEILRPEDITLDAHQLWLGSVRVLLPAMPSTDQPFERIIAVMPDGDRYEMDLLFNEVMQLQADGTHL